MRCVGQSDDRAKVVVIGIDLIRHQELGGIKTGKGRKLECAVCGLSKVLVPQAHSQGQIFRGFPRVLDEITLPEQVRVIDRIADVDVGSAACSAEIIDKVRQRREATALKETK